MFSIIPDVYAQTAAAGGQGNQLLGLLPYLLIFLVFFFLVIRPQQKKAKAHRALLSALEKGDKVITSSGIYGTITKIFDEKDYIQVEIAEKTTVKMQKSHIADVIRPKSSPKE